MSSPPIPPRRPRSALHNFPPSSVKWPKKEDTNKPGPATASRNLVGGSKSSSPSLKRPISHTSDNMEKQSPLSDSLRPLSCMSGSSSRGKPESLRRNSTPPVEVGSLHMLSSVCVSGDWKFAAGEFEHVEEEDLMIPSSKMVKKLEKEPTAVDINESAVGKGKNVSVAAEIGKDREKVGAKCKYVKQLENIHKVDSSTMKQSNEIQQPLLRESRDNMLPLERKKIPESGGLSDNHAIRTGLESGKGVVLGTGRNERGNLKIWLTTKKRKMTTEKILHKEAGSKEKLLEEVEKKKELTQAEDVFAEMRIIQNGKPVRKPRSANTNARSSSKSACSPFPEKVHSHDKKGKQPKAAAENPKKYKQPKAAVEVSEKLYKQPKAAAQSSEKKYNKQPKVVAESSGKKYKQPKVAAESFEEKFKQPKDAEECSNKITTNRRKENEKERRKQLAKERREMKKKLPKFSISLTRNEIEYDVELMSQGRLSRKPKKRLKAIQRAIDQVCPGTWLSTITPDSYLVSDNPGKAMKDGRDA